MTTPMNEVIHHLRRAGLLHDAEEGTDGQLLERFIRRREAAALEALVRRHAPMVWGVCRRVLRNHHDAEDAFQATFLVLVKKAASVRPRAMVGNWLYGVARQTALKARATAAKRRARARQVADMPEPAASEQDLGSDWLAALDQELSRLPAMYRVAIVLCDLEGKTRKEAARQLGVPDGTMAARVARGRTLLAKRLARQGLIVSGGALAGALAQQAASACVPAAAVHCTIRAVTLVAAGSLVTPRLVSARVAALAEGVIKTMLMTRIRNVLGLCLAVGLLTLGSVAGYRTLAAEKAPPEPPKDKLADTLVLLDKQWWEAASKHDVDTLSKILADDWVGPGGSNWTKAVSLDHYRRFRYTEVTFLTERRVVRIDEHTAIMTYEVSWRAEDKGHAPEGGSRDRIVHCWVQRDGGWFVKFTECVPVGPAPAVPTKSPARLSARASSSWEKNTTPDRAFDGNRETYWNSGGYAPAWIEADLGASTPLAGIVLIPLQDVPGATTHEVWVSDRPIGDDRTKAKLMHTFEGDTTNAKQLTFDFPKGLSARYVQIRTTKSPTWIAWWEIEIRYRDGGRPLAVPPAPQPDPKPPANDKEALQGTWQVVSVESGGKDVTRPLDRKEKWVVKGGGINVHSEDRDLVVSHSEVFAVRPDKSPKEIDINPYPVGLFRESDIVKGIYTLDGDVWKVCLPHAPLVPPDPEKVAPRPTELAAKEGSATTLITLKRVK
jgi:RNA polymerase sigma factor (sigma-70 family)